MLGGCLGLIWRIFVDALVARVIGGMVDGLVKNVFPQIVARLVKMVCQVFRRANC